LEIAPEVIKKILDEKIEEFSVDSKKHSEDMSPEEPGKSNLLYSMNSSRISFFKKEIQED
jgi:hypothetical protein